MAASSTATKQVLRHNLPLLLTRASPPLTQRAISPVSLRRALATTGTSSPGSDGGKPTTPPGGSSSSRCPITGLRNWFKGFTVKYKLCPWSHLGLPKTKFMVCTADSTWTKDKVYEIVRREGLELLDSPEAKFPTRMGTFIVFDHLKYGELDPYFHHCYGKIHKGDDFHGPDKLELQYFSPKWSKSFFSPFEAFHLVTREALEWAEQKFYRVHPDVRHDHLAVAEYVHTKNEKVYDQLHDNGELLKLVKESRAIREECLGPGLGELPPVDLDSFLSEQRQEEHVHVS